MVAVSRIILAIIGAFQLVENRVIQASPQRGRYYVVLVKLGLATILLNHTQEVAINSSYYPIFYLPIMTAAMYFGPLGTLLWTALAAGAYCSYLFPVQVVGVPNWIAKIMGAGSEAATFTIDAAGISELLMRILFFFLVGMIVNRFVMEYRIQVSRYQALAETLSEANRSLKQAQAEARRAERLAALAQRSGQPVPGFREAIAAGPAFPRVDRRYREILEDHRRSRRHNQRYD